MEKSDVSETTTKAGQIEALKGFIRKQRDGRQVKKALAVKLLYQGHTYESVVSILDVSLGAIHEWKHLYERAGLTPSGPKGLLRALTKGGSDRVAEAKRHLDAR